MKIAAIGQYSIHIHQQQFNRGKLAVHQTLSYSKGKVAAGWGVAVSGGADSMALLHMLHATRPDLTVLHVNYGLRGPESEADREFVSQKAAELGLPCLIHRVHLPPGNLEQEARRARYNWFASLVTDGTVEKVATGHTKDDQAETVVSRFLRGAGTAGLAAILPETREGIVRPLLLYTRADLRNYLNQHNLTWREDSSNNWLRFERNRIRHTLLPELERNWNPKIATALTQTADWARAEEDYWQAELPRLTQNWLRFAKSHAAFDLNGLNAAPLAVARRAVRWAVKTVSTHAQGPDFAHVERVLDLARRPGKLASFRTAAWQATRSLDTLQVSQPVPKPAAYREILQVPGTCVLPDGSAELRLDLKPLQSVYNNGEQLVDWSLIRGSLELRNWLPGDRFQQAGRFTASKLKHYFQEAGIPSWDRSGWPVITYDNSILWTRGQGVCAAYVPTAGTATVLRILEVPCGVSGESPNRKVLR